MSRYTNAERNALTPTEDVILDTDAQWAMMENLDVADLRRKAERRDDQYRKQDSSSSHVA